MLLALHRLCSPTLDLHLLLFSASRPPTTSGALPAPSANGPSPAPAPAAPFSEEALISFLLRCAAEQSSGQFFNLAHSVTALQVRPQDGYGTPTSYAARPPAWLCSCSSRSTYSSPPTSHTESHALQVRLQRTWTPYIRPPKSTASSVAKHYSTCGLSHMPCSQVAVVLPFRVPLQSDCRASTSPCAHSPSWCPCWAPTT